ncbi:MAG: serine/threonine-protein phosphatase [Gammaproteobacteria bacterium]|nr:serine/threonine-protein phosphatase [Gammaproteobacteria bacterium]
MNFIQTYIQAELDKPELLHFGFGTLAAFSNKSPEREDTPNEDCVAIFQLDNDSAVFMVADGLGGLPGGNTASKLAIQAMKATLNECQDISSLREAILDGFEKADRLIQQKAPAAATTLAVVEYQKGQIRPYHVGDSMIIITGQRGKLKLQTVSHSPVGYAVESGLLDENEAVHHEERHLVSNVVGSGDMRIEIGTTLSLSRFDTLIMATDGLFDNLYIEEIIDQARKGRLDLAAGSLIEKASERMTNPELEGPSHADDLSLILFRQTHP